jgi:hypothetical protein
MNKLLLTICAVAFTALATQAQDTWDAWQPLVTRAGNLAGYSRLGSIVLDDGTYRHLIEFKNNPAISTNRYCAIRSCRCNESSQAGWTDLGIGNGFAPRLSVRA